MVQKNKKTQKQKFETFIENFGLGVIDLATVINMAELSGKEGSRMLGIIEPAYVAVGRLGVVQNQTNELRRSGKEEIRHTSATYGVFVRSQPTAGSR